MTDGPVDDFLAEILDHCSRPLPCEARHPRMPWLRCTESYDHLDGIAEDGLRRHRHTDQRQAGIPDDNRTALSAHVYTWPG